MSKSPSSERPAQLWAVVPAAGTGRRMQAEQPKQYLHIQGRAVLEHTLSVLLARTDIQQLVLCVAEDDTTWADLEITHQTRVVTTLGGDTRAESVLNGLRTLAAVAHENDWVLVHDAARPCLSESVLDKLIVSLTDHEVGGILAVPAKDTLKQCGANGRVIGTLDRDSIYLAQTPQMFRFGLLYSALSSANEQGWKVTDESSALELAGYSPLLVEGDYRNLKITTPEDLHLAAAILAGQPEN